MTDIPALRPLGWSRLNITLHWLVAILIVVQLLNHEHMVVWWDSFHGEGSVTSTDVTFGWVHILSGISIFLFTALRIWDRATRGRPPYPAAHPAWITGLSKITHFLIFAILIVMPVAGLAAWITNDERPAGFHTFLWTPLLVLIGLHIAGALVEHFFLKTDVVRRMVRPAS